MPGAGAAVGYDYRNADGLHITFADDGGFNALLIRGGAKAKLVRDAATYAQSPVRIPDSKHVTPQELETGITALKVEPTRIVVAYCT